MRCFILSKPPKTKESWFNFIRITLYNQHRKRWEPCKYVKLYLCETFLSKKYFIRNENSSTMCWKILVWVSIHLDLNIVFKSVKHVLCQFSVVLFQAFTISFLERKETKDKNRYKALFCFSYKPTQSTASCSDSYLTTDLNVACKIDVSKCLTMLLLVFIY